MPAPILVWVVAQGGMELTLLTIAGVAALRAAASPSGSRGSMGNFSAASTSRPADVPLPAVKSAAAFREWVRRNKSGDYCPVPETLGFHADHDCGDAAVALDNLWTFRAKNVTGTLGVCPAHGRPLEELEGLYQRKARSMPVGSLRVARGAPGSTGIVLYNPMGGPVRPGSSNHYINVCFDAESKPVFVDCSGGRCRHVDLSAEETAWGTIDPFRAADARVIWTLP